MNMTLPKEPGAVIEVSDDVAAKLMKAVSVEFVPDPPPKKARSK